ncbi:MAG: hypothetical protein LCI00_14810 [Chloroflexi bacterium]|nr:hypothetical protein [Chloroflexota bacterium]
MNQMLNPNPYLMLSGELGFSAADLTANRLGVMTAKQREQVYTRRLQAMKLPAVVLVLVIFGGLLFEAEWLMIVFGAACMISILVAIWVRFAQDLDSPVEAIAGQWTPYRSTFGRSALHMGGLMFHLPQAAHQAFNERARYRLYFTPGTRTILSAEIIN